MDTVFLAMSSVGQTTAVQGSFLADSMLLAAVFKKMCYVGRVGCKAVSGIKFKLLEAWSLAG